MKKSFLHCRAGGANLEYALFLAAISVFALSGMLYLGENVRPQLAAWQNDTPLIDNTLTGSITKQEDAKTYRVYQLPPGSLSRSL